MFQQSLNKYELIVVVLNCMTSKIDELILFIPSFKAQLSTFKKFEDILLTGKALHNGSICKI